MLSGPHWHPPLFQNPTMAEARAPRMEFGNVLIETTAEATPQRVLLAAQDLASFKNNAHFEISMI